MQYSYENSVAQRWMQFRSTIQATEDVSTEIFNAISVYVPARLASSNIVDYDGAPTESTPVVITVTADNYSSKLQGQLLRQWGPVFKDGSNFDITMYLIVFADSAVVLGPDDVDFKSTITHAALTNAFNNLYHISYFKTMFAASYGQHLEAAPDVMTTDKYWDEALALAQLCESKPELSYGVFNAFTWMPETFINTADPQPINATTVEEVTTYSDNTTSLFLGLYADKTTQNVGGIEIYGADAVIGTDGLASTFSWYNTESAAIARAAFFASFLGIVAPTKSWLVVHAGNAHYGSADLSALPNMAAEIFNVWFTERNASGQYVGNKFEKTRLTGADIRPTGDASWLNTAANVNLPTAMMERLDDYHSTYFMSISDRYMNDCIANDATSFEGIPVTASMIEKWIDYNTSQQLATIVTDTDTVAHPYLRNEETYQMVQDVLLANIQRFARAGVIKDIVLKFPAYSELTSSDTDIIVGAGAWEATYVYPLRKVVVGGVINV